VANDQPHLEIGLIAAIVAANQGQPTILSVPGGGAAALPFGPFNPLDHRTFEVGLREWVRQQTALTLGHVEQLYTFGDLGRHAVRGDTGPHQVSVGYLALTRTNEEAETAIARTGASWRAWYDFFPWEDWREGRPALLDAVMTPALDAWVAAQPRQASGRARDRRERVAIAFGRAAPWDEERALDRYEILYEAGLVAESVRDGRVEASPIADRTGQPMQFDHRRILATAISRLRGKLKYRPVIFELMPDTFTLTALQDMAEALSGRRLHKQNFRRLVTHAELVEPTGEQTQRGRGRPAELFRFRRDILRERPAPGLRLGTRA